ncbi:MAG TPA: hypothetical protein VF253_00290 [Candidatus Limnocylindrales bacterium]
MIAQIGPLVEAGTVVRHARSIHLLGGLVGGLASGVLLAFAGELLASAVPPIPVVGQMAIAASLVFAGLLDMHAIPSAVTTPIRQTPGSWSCRLGPSGALFAWGADLGTGVTTTLPHFALVVLPAYALTGANFAVAVAVMGLYGFSRAAAVGAALWPATEYPETCSRLNGLTRQASVAVGGAAVLVGSLLTSVTFM